MRQYALTMERINNQDTGCEYYSECLGCPFPVCIKEELSDKKRRAFLEQYHNEEMLSIGEVAKRLNVSITSVQRLSNIGLLKSIRINDRGDRRFFKSKLPKAVILYKSRRKQAAIIT